MTKLIILDRDGVINVELGDYVTRVEDFKFEAGSVDAVVRLHQAGYKIGVATNQAGIGKGRYSETMLHDIHTHMLNAIRVAGGEIDSIKFSPSPDDAHRLRKPNTGMLDDLLTEFGADAEDVCFVGDNITDLQCAVNAGCQPVLVRTGKGLQTLAALNDYPDVASRTKVFDNLARFVDDLLG